MPYIVKYYLHYGFFGKQLFDTMYAGGSPAKIALGIYIAITIIELLLIRRIRKRDGCLTIPLIFLAHDLLLGENAAAVQIILCGIIFIIRSNLEPDNTPRKPKRPKTPDELEDDRMAALRIEQLHADELLRCMDNVEQARYIAEFQQLVYDKTVTPDEIESRLRHWEFYRRNPMLGSEEYRRTHPDE